MTDISNRDDLLDIREVIERVEELRSERDDPAQGLESDEANELSEIESFLDEMKGSGGGHEWEGDWYPVTLVRDSYFEDFARDEAEQLGFIKSEQQWPANCIDWEKAARELQQDYGQADFDGVTYWYRN